MVLGNTCSPLNCSGCLVRPGSDMHESGGLDGGPLMFGNPRMEGFREELLVVWELVATASALHSSQTGPVRVNLACDRLNVQQHVLHRVRETSTEADTKERRMKELNN